MKDSGGSDCGDQRMLLRKAVSVRLRDKEEKVKLDELVEYLQKLNEDELQG